MSTPHHGKSRRSTRSLHRAATTASRRALAEVLESRTLLASISGTIYQDLNANGVRDTGEPGMAGVTVFIDENRDGVLNADEVSQVTNGSGAYTFNSVNPGVWSVNVVVPGGWTNTYSMPRLIQTPQAIAYDLSWNKAYYSNFGSSANQKASLDGSTLLFYAEGTPTQPRSQPPFPGTTSQGMFVVSSPPGVFKSLGLVGDHTVSGDGRYIAYQGSSSPSLVIYDKTTNSTDSYSFSTYLDDRPLLSGDGNLVVFTSSSSNVVSGDTNNAADVFLLNRTTRSFTRVSISQAGRQTTGAGNPQITTDGRYVMFSSLNDVNGDGLGGGYFVYNTTDRSLRRINSLNPQSRSAFLSSNGRFVVHQGVDYLITLTDLKLNTSRVLNFTAAEGQSLSLYSISSEGRFVAFTTTRAYDALDVNGLSDLYLLDTVSGQRTCVTVNASLQPSNAPIIFGAVGGNGLFALAWTAASNLAGNDRDGSYDAMVLPSRVSGPAGEQLAIITSSAQLTTNLATGLHQFATIAGRVRVDINGDGVPDGTSGLAGAIVYVDTNNNGTRDLDERWVTTTADDTSTTSIDESGNFIFTSVFAGTYAIRLELGGNFRQTLPSDAVSRPSVELSSVTYTFAQTVPSVAVAADGKTYFIIEDRRFSGGTTLSFDVKRLDSDTGQFSFIATGLGSNNSLSVSGDQRYLVFSGDGSNIAAGDTNNVSDVFLMDTVANSIQRISLTAAGAQTKGASSNASISEDGRFVVYLSSDDDIGTSDGDGQPDVFLYDRLLGVTAMVSRLPDGRNTVGACSNPIISGNGRYVSFTTTYPVSSNDFNGASDTLIYDRLTGTTSIVGAFRAFGTAVTAITYDGRFVLCSGVNNASQASFVQDVTSGSVDVCFTDLPGVGISPLGISDDARFVLGTAYSGSAWLVYVFDRLRRVSVAIPNPRQDRSWTSSTLVVPTTDFMNVGIYQQSTSSSAGMYRVVVPGVQKTGAANVTLLPGQTATATFASTLSSVVAGSVYWDRNLTGARDANETGIESVDITVYRDNGDGVFNSVSDVVAERRLTTGSGNYSVSGLSAGSYWIEVSTASAPLSGYKLAPGATVRQLVTIANSSSNVTASFGFYKPIVVTNPVDENDGDTSAADISLREALGLAAASPGLDVIEFGTNVSGTTTLLSTLGQLTVDSDVIINGPGSSVLTVAGSGNGRVMYVSPGVNLTLRDLTVTGGSTSLGGGIYAAEGSNVGIERCVLTGNTASQRGGGVYASASTTLSLTDTLVSGNTAIDQGGGIYSAGLLNLTRTSVVSNSATSSLTGRGRGGGVYAAGDVLAINSTIGANQATFHGGGLYGESGSLTLRNVTVSANTADSDTNSTGTGGGLYIDIANCLLQNTVIAGNLRGAGAGVVADDVTGPLAAQTIASFIGAGTGTGLADGVAGNRVGTSAAALNAGLLPLTLYGTALPIFLPRWDSPLLDAGSNGAVGSVTNDQSGNSRIIDFDGLNGAQVDIGAVELNRVIRVNGTNQETVDTDGKISLNEAIALANTQPGPDVIDFDPSLWSNVAGGQVVLPALSATVSSVLRILGPSGARVRLSFSSPLTVGAAGWLTATDVTFSSGQSISNSGRLDAERVLFASNSTTGSGGAIASSGTLNLANVTFTGNTAVNSGGAIAITGGTATLNNVTIARNRARSSGTGSGVGGGIWISAGTARLNNTILALNTIGLVSAQTTDNASGSFSTQSSFNFVGTTNGSTGLSTGAGTRFGDPKLESTLSYSGGSVETIAVLPGSPVVDAGSDALAVGLLSALTTDARGLPRIKDGDDDKTARVDIGAFEQQYPLNQAPTLSSIAEIGGAVDTVAFDLRQDLILNASDAADPDNARTSLGFRVESVLAGTVTLNGQPVVAGVTVVNPGQTLKWTPPTGLKFGSDGTALVPAMVLRAYDGQVASVTGVTLNIRVTTVASPVNYAVLYSGGDSPSLNHSIYYNNLRRMYGVLVNQYGLRPENIAIIYADGRSSAADQPDGSNSDMSFAPNVLSATRDNLRSTLVSLSSRMDANDQLFFWAYDHGLGTPAQPATTGEEVLRGWGNSETVTDDDLAVWLQGMSKAKTGRTATDYGVSASYAGIRPGYSTYVFGQCFAGGMLDNLIAPGSVTSNVFGAAAGNHYEVTYGDFFISAFTDALEAGVNRTDDAFYFAYNRDARAQSGYLSGAYPPNAGAWQFNVEHPWRAGGSFPIFAVNRSSTNATPVVQGVTPLKIPVGASELELSYDLVKAAVDAVDPTGQAVSFRFTGVDVGTLSKNGVTLSGPSVSATLKPGEKLTWKPPASPSALMNALRLRAVASDGTETASDTVLPIRLGNPASGVVAQGETLTVAPDVKAAPLSVLSNDLGSGLQIVRLGQPTNGSAVLQNGLLLYTPAPEFTGTDRLSYVIRDAAGNTDLASVTINVQQLQAVSAGVPAFKATVLGLPDRWAEMPTTWEATFRNSLPTWTSTFGRELSESGDVLVGVERPYVADSLVPFVGSSQTTYRWTSDPLPPYWNWNASTNTVASNARMNVDIETGLTPPTYLSPSIRSQLQGKDFAYGIEVTSLANPQLLPGRLLIPPGNATETSQPSLGVMLINPGTPNEDLVDMPFGPQQIPLSVSPSLTSPDGRFLSLVTSSLTLAGANSVPTAQLWYLGAVGSQYQGQHVIRGTSGSGRSGGEAMLSDGDVLGAAQSAVTVTGGNQTAFFSAYRYDYATDSLTYFPAAPGGLMSSALASNASGDTVGIAAPQLVFRDVNVDLRLDRRAMLKAGSRALLWSNGTVRDLGTLAADKTTGWATAYDINDRGLVVGASNGSAFVSVAGVMYDLNTLVRSGLPTYTDPVTGQSVPRRIISADSINNAGQILATLDNGDNSTRAVLLDLSSSLTLTPDTAVAYARQPVTLSPLANDQGASFLVSVTQPTAGKVTIDPVSNVLTFDPAGAFADLAPSSPPRVISFSYTARDNFGASASSTVTLSVLPLSSFYVSNLTPTASGFTVTFNTAPSLAPLNLFSGPANPGRAADLTVRDNTGALVSGSLISESTDNLTWRFIARGGPLTAPSYSLTLRSGSDAFTSARGALDGDADNVPGGNYSLTFTPPAAGLTRTLTLSDVSRVPMQTLATPALPAGLPIVLSNAQGTRSVSFTLRYDPALLTLSDITLASGLPADWTLVRNLASPGVAVIAAGGTTPLPAGAATIASLVGNLTASATPLAISALRLTDVSVNENALPSTGDDSTLVVALTGDADLSGYLTSNDVNLVTRLVVGTDTGLDGLPLTDPAAVVDLTRDGTISMLDASELGSSPSTSRYLPVLPTLTFTGNPASPSAFTLAYTGGNTATLTINSGTPASLSPGYLASITLASAAQGNSLVIQGTPPTGSALRLQGSFSFSGSASYPNITVTGTGSTLTASRLSLGSLSLEAGASVRLTGSASTASVLSRLNIAAGAFLDLGNSSLVLSNTPADLARPLLTGNLIRTTASNPQYTTLSLFSNSLTPGIPYFTSYNGATGLATGDLIIKTTYIGDTNLDGILNGKDYKSVTEGYFLQQSGWAWGDVDNSGGPVTLADLSAFMTAYNYWSTRTQPNLGNGQTIDPLDSSLVVPGSTSPMLAVTQGATTPQGPTTPLGPTTPQGPTQPTTLPTASPSTVIPPPPDSSPTPQNTLLLKTATQISAVANSPLKTIVLESRDPDNRLRTRDVSPVQVRIVSGPAGSSLLGNQTPNLRSGRASFSNLRLSLPGNYVLEFSAQGHAPTEIKVTVAATGQAAATAKAAQAHFVSPTSFADSHKLLTRRRSIFSHIPILD